ncbi:hypothetical protein [Vacuolonema iberomarrocanum]|uniref:hypothetical protein n=1 Tax=Vacuolonema iberomarrocanum TaxID=3454632 RepID=UPI0019DDF6C1|nr:hypothetical protein [filamentous cyanobacterium LEGE 07170]
MALNRLEQGHLSHSRVKDKSFHRDIPKAQQTIYDYLLEIVKSWSPDDVLTEFRHLFIHHVNTISSHTLPSLYEIVFANKEAEFRNTIKRGCYILVNNWDIRRNLVHVQKLIELFDDPIIWKPSMSPTMRRLRQWLQNFITSGDFQELKLFTRRYTEQKLTHWTERYTSYLLVPQYINLENPAEQRHAARLLSKQLREQFKFSLALYTAHSQKTIAHPAARNPTALGDNVLHLIKMMVARKGRFSYANLAHIFLQQTKDITYQRFKKSLRRYLLFSINDPDTHQALEKGLSDRFDNLYESYDDKVIDDALLLRTCNRIIEYLTTEDHEEPSPLFIQIMSYGNPLVLVVLLLKLVLICRYARTHLEARIANLVTYYQDFSESECKWVIHFFEIFDITMTIYAENVEFNLVNMRGIPHASNATQQLAHLKQYRIFSQMREQQEDPSDMDAMELALYEALIEDMPDTQGAYSNLPPNYSSTQQ